MRPAQGQEGKAAMSEHTGPADAGPVTLINVFEIPAEQVDAFIEGWAERARIMSTHPGFRDTRLHRALSPEGRFQLVNVAHWDSAESYAAARADDEFQASRAATVADLHDRGVDVAFGQGEKARAVRQGPRVVANPQLYRVVAGYAIPPGADEPLPADKALPDDAKIIGRG
jgi:heme oxygenase (mycobilin-producing)